MPDQWYYSKQGQRVGPVSEEELRHLASSGQVQPIDLVWTQGMAQWTQASQVFPPPPPDPSAPPPIPNIPQRSQPDWQAQVQSKTREAAKRVRDLAQSEQVRQATDKVKTRWRGLSGRKKAIVVCLGALCLYFVWRILAGGGSSYTPDTLLSLVEKDSRATAKRLESTWITVTGIVQDAEYLRNGGLLIPKDTSAIRFSSSSRRFTVEAFFEGDKSGGVETNSLSRGDTVTVKGKVDVVSDRVVGLKDCSIASVHRR